MPETAAPPTGPRVLVVDDDPLVLGSVRDALAASYRVTATPSPRDALEILARSPHEILLVDLMMQEMNGIELVHAAKALDPLLVAVVMTGYGTKAVAIEALREGADDFLEKPLTLDVLTQAVEKGWRAISRERENAALLAELQHANAELKHANEELRAMASFADLDPAPLLRVGADGVILRGNPAADRLVSGASLVGQRLGTVLPGLADVDIDTCIARGEIVVRETTIGGRIYQLAIRGVAELAIGHVYGSDITELDRTREQLHHSQRLEAIGKLAGGVAHDFNNLLTVVALAAQHLSAAVTDPTDAEVVAEISAAAAKGSQLTRQLLAFSRHEAIAPSVVQLNQVVEELHPLLRRTVGEHIEMALALTPELCPVLIDRGQIEQVIVNLVVNARDALPAGGRLTIETSSALLDAEYVQRHLGSSHGLHAVLAVTDNGCGMSREVQARVFEPFFTTKERGSGSGMGLATAYGVVKSAGGSIWIYSEEGRGTTVKIFLPATALSPTAEVAPEGALPLGGGETVLVVEDDESLRKVALRMLTGGGYRVLTAPGGEEALRIAVEHTGPIHLLLTDVIMPGQNGRAVARAVLERRPEVKVLYMSGYTDNIIAQQGALDAGVSLLEKPFTREQLLRRVRAAITAPDPTES